MTVADELARRLRLWEQVSRGDAGDADPRMLRSALVYGGAQGIWVDKKTTGALAENGVTVSILHTGRHYADDLSDDGLIYQYPKTRRPPGRDAAEVTTKNAGALSPPIFAILPGTRARDFIDQILKDKNGHLRQRIFEENVRDFLGMEGDVEGVRVD